MTLTRDLPDATSPGPTSADRTSRIAEFLDLLACPLCRGRLLLGDAALRCASCGAHHRLHDGVPVLVPGHEPRTMAADHASFQLPRELLDDLAPLDHWLHVGAGASAARIENCIELELNVFRHTDLIGDITRLPFRSRSLDAVVAFNVFEHVRDPWQAAREIHRVLVPGGLVVIQSAFLQPVHADPDHYFAATDHGLGEWFAEFVDRDVRVSGNFSPMFALSWFASELMGAADRAGFGDTLRSVTLEDCARFWREPDQRDGEVWHAVHALPAHEQRRLAAGFELRARRSGRE